jgi:hypothetical protein
MSRAWLAAVVLLLAGCKSPSYRNGGLVCGPGGDCPQGWHCALDNSCWRNGHDPTPPDDGDLASAMPLDFAVGPTAADLAGVTDLAPLCGWSMPPSNFDPCTAGAATGDWVAINGTYNTDTGIGGAGPMGAIVQEAGGPMVRLVRVGRFSVPPGITLTLQGSMPLIIAADTTIDVAGTVAVYSGTGGAVCSVVVNGVAGTRCGSGAAGGAFGANGGAGGGCSGVTPPMEPSAIGNAMLTPLLGGCSGGHGGGAGAATTGFGGGPGGGLQLSARSSISVSGIINAGGGGGGGGVGTLSGCGGANGCATGGGGGGSGGAILLESPMISVDGRLCANGGAGGGGGGNGNTNIANGGNAGACDTVSAGGGAGLAGGGSGQGGGYVAHGDGYDGLGSGSFDGGGGGGGSVGRIRIRAGNAAPVAVTAVVTPTPYLN